MDPFNLLLGALLTAGGFTAGRSVALQRLGKQLRSDLTSLEAKVKAQVVTSNNQLHGLLEANRQMAALDRDLGQISERVTALEQRPVVQPEAVETVQGKLEQLEQFASTAAGEIAGLRQRLLSPPPAPQPAWLQGVTAAPAAQPDRSAQEAALLSQAVASAQAEFARRQRVAQAAAFQQPPGGQ